MNSFPSNARATLLVAVVAAAVSTICTRVGVIGIFFLLPFALAGFFRGGKALALAAFLAILGNCLFQFLAWLDLQRESLTDPAPFRWSAMYYAVMVLGFCWINAGNGLWTSPAGNEASPPQARFSIPPVYRLVIGAFAVSAALIPMLLGFMADAAFNHMLAQTLGAFTEMNETLNAEDVFASIMYLGIRGGILASVILFFALSRQAALLVVWITRRERPGGGLVTFHAGQPLIWVLSLALGAVLLGRTAGITTLEIGAWNILVFCATLYLAQGAGIALYYLARLPPLFRVLVNVGVLLVLFRPGINMSIPGSLILAGIMENWVPFRASGSQGSPPTPEA
ncbi:hypothetical protein FACS1894161_5380 [Spirochaetia bacterium]|nr:hypothetical protein FACS1894161_5380 [Spirochaetia bacterium]